MHDDVPAVTTRRTALITGASAGIGAAFAEAFARRGTDVVIVARRRQRLEALAERLRREYSVDVRILVEDLSDPTSPARIKEAMEETGSAVDILVNNAGYGVPDTFLAHPWQTHRNNLEVMICSIASLCHLFLPAMRERRFGRIINVASLAGLIPGTPGHTLYGAEKAWLILFSESLAAETRDDGVRIIASCPGFTYSEFHDVTGTRDRVSRLPSFMWMDAAQVAEQAIRAVEGTEPVVINGHINRLIGVMSRLLPRRLARFLVNLKAADFRNTGV